MIDLKITKHCSKCESLKLLTDFHRDRRTASGYAYNCKACKLVYDKPHHADRRKHMRERRSVERKRVADKWRKWLDADGAKPVKSFEMQELLKKP